MIRQPSGLQIELFKLYSSTVPRWVAGLLWWVSAGGVESISPSLLTCLDHTHDS